MLEIGPSYGASAGRKGSRWRRLRAQCLAVGEANGTPCYGCGQPMTYQWVGNPRHPMAPTVHHVIELWQGGDPHDPANHVPCHFGCNVKLSNRARRGVRVMVLTAATALADPMTSRQW